MTELAPILVMTTTTEKFVQTRCKNGHVFNTEVIVTSEPCDVPEHMKADRWFKEVGACITKVNKVVVSRASILEGLSPEHNNPYSYIEIHTELGRACVVHFVTGSEIQGYVGNDGVTRSVDTWRKHGNIVGHGNFWMMAQMVSNRRVNTNNTKKCPSACLAEVYARLTKAEHPWSVYDRKVA